MVLWTWARSTMCALTVWNKVNSCRHMEVLSYRDTRVHMCMYNACQTCLACNPIDIMDSLSWPSSICVGLVFRTKIPRRNFILLLQGLYTIVILVCWAGWEWSLVCFQAQNLFIKSEETFFQFWLVQFPLWKLWFKKMLSRWSGPIFCPGWQALFYEVGTHNVKEITIA